MKTKISLLGSTGSIGKSTLDIISKKKSFFIINTFSALSNYKKICFQIKKYKPKNFIISNYKIYEKVKKKFKNNKVSIFNDYSKLPKNVLINDITVSAIPGLAGLEPTIEFTKKSKKILLANKESVICGWNLLKKIAKNSKTKIIPIDSEHFSIYQLAKNHKDNEIKNIFITASGGPFLNTPKKLFRFIKPAQAIKHPKWKMGKKISIDSATLMNKILELIEAYKIFPFNFNKYKILIHPQSLVHAIVQFNNGMTKFLYHEPDMKIPISNAIFNNSSNISNFIEKKKEEKQIQNLDFLNVNKNRFPVIKLIPKLNKFISTPIIINAANEILIDQFIKKKISYNSISNYIFEVLRDKNYKKYAIRSPINLKTIYSIDMWARLTAVKIINKK